MFILESYKKTIAIKYGSLTFNGKITSCYCTSIWHPILGNKKKERLMFGLHTVTVLMPFSIIITHTLFQSYDSHFYVTHKESASSNI